MRIGAAAIAVFVCSGSFATDTGQSVTTASTASPSAAPSTQASSVRKAENLAVKEWHSPITFDLDAGWLRTLPFGESATIKDLPAFYCDGVALDSLAVEKHLARKSGAVEVEFGLNLHVRRQRDDKVVALEFTLIDGEQRLHLGRLEGLEISEGDSLSEEVEFKISKEMFAAYTADGSSPQLSVSMVVVDN